MFVGGKKQIRGTDILYITLQIYEKSTQNASLYGKNGSLVAASSLVAA